MAAETHPQAVGKAVPQAMRILILMLWSAALWLVSLEAIAQSEADYTAEWCELHNMTYDVPGDGYRPSSLVFETPTGHEVIADCIGKSAVVEVDPAYRYMSGLGQAITYGRLARLDPILLLIVESPDDCEYVLDARWVAWESNQRLQVVTTGLSCN